ncbi:MAG: hypothetical protein LBP55_02135 [Candidatus Adiutrix sp.]|jgi:hypothetical protein|nr:hypothetical protein [Candidatus Adiutrix sp.]
MSLTAKIKFTLAALLLLALAACADKEAPPEPVALPSNSIEKAAVQGLVTSYRNSTMWQIQNPRVIRTTPVAPNAIVLQDHDPKELYCVCVEYEARYKVDWTTTESSNWDRTVRNLLVMRTQSDHIIAMKPLNICPAFCE